MSCPMSPVSSPLSSGLGHKGWNPGGVWDTVLLQTVLLHGHANGTQLKLVAEGVSFLRDPQEQELSPGSQTVDRVFPGRHPHLRDTLLPDPKAEVSRLESLVSGPRLEVSSLLQQVPKDVPPSRPPTSQQDSSL